MRHPEAERYLNLAVCLQGSNKKYVFREAEQLLN
jgi:hypothetical protein